MVVRQPGLALSWWGSGGWDFAQIAFYYLKDSNSRKSITIKILGNGTKELKESMGGRKR